MSSNAAKAKRLAVEEQRKADELFGVDVYSRETREKLEKHIQGGDSLIQKLNGNLNRLKADIAIAESQVNAKVHPQGYWEGRLCEYKEQSEWMMRQAMQRVKELER